MEDSLSNTGERMLPDNSDPGIFWEHVMRYRFAMPYVSGKRVLDVACGEGYGVAAMVKAKARSALGVDISAAAVDHSRKKYGIDAVVGSATDIPAPSSYFDLVTSFETIEHVREPADFLNECLRVLRPGGKIIVSTPNKPIYQLNTPENDYHCSEMSLNEFEGSVSAGFRNVQILGQIIPLTARQRLLSQAIPVRILRKLTCPSSSPQRMPYSKGRLLSLVSRPLSIWERMLDTRVVKKVDRPDLEKSLYLVAIGVKE